MWRCEYVGEDKNGEVSKGCFDEDKDQPGLANLQTTALKWIRENYGAKSLMINNLTSGASVVSDGTYIVGYINFFETTDLDPMTVRL